MGAGGTRVVAADICLMAGFFGGFQGFLKLVDVIANQIRLRKSDVAKAFQKKRPVPTGTFVADFLG